MKAGPRTLKRLFEGGRQFRIPVYQRPYVWTRDRQWEPLWNDVANTARQFAKSLHAASLDLKQASRARGASFGCASWHKANLEAAQRTMSQVSRDEMAC